MNFKNLCIFIFPAICGAAIVYSITPNNSIGSLGVTAPANGVSTAQAFVVELVLTFILVFVVFAATDPGRGLTGYGVPLAIGICVFICLMHGVGLLATNVSLKAYESDGLSGTLFRLSVSHLYQIRLRDCISWTQGQNRRESNRKAILRVTLDGLCKLYKHLRHIGIKEDQSK